MQIVIPWNASKVFPGQYTVREHLQSSILGTLAAIGIIVPSNFQKLTLAQSSFGLMFLQTPVRYVVVLLLGKARQADRVASVANIIMFF